MLYLMGTYGTKFLRSSNRFFYQIESNDSFEKIEYTAITVFDNLKTHR